MDTMQVNTAQYHTF